MVNVCPVCKTVEEETVPETDGVNYKICGQECAETASHDKIFLDQPRME